MPVDCFCNPLRAHCFTAGDEVSALCLGVLSVGGWVGGWVVFIIHCGLTVLLLEMRYLPFACWSCGWVGWVGGGVTVFGVGGWVGGWVGGRRRRGRLA